VGLITTQILVIASVLEKTAAMKKVIETQTQVKIIKIATKTDQKVLLRFTNQVE